MNVVGKSSTSENFDALHMCYKPMHKAPFTSPQSKEVLMFDKETNKLEKLDHDKKSFFDGVADDLICWDSTHQILYGFVELYNNKE